MINNLIKKYKRKIYFKYKGEIILKNKYGVFVVLDKNLKIDTNKTFKNPLINFDEERTLNKFLKENGANEDFLKGLWDYSNLKEMKEVLK